MTTARKNQFDAYNESKDNKNKFKPRIIKDDFTNDYQKYISGNNQVSERLKNKLGERKIYQVVTDLLERKEIGIDGDVLKIPVHSTNGKIISIHSVSLLSVKDERYLFEQKSNTKGYLTALNDKSTNRLYVVEGFCDFCSLLSVKSDINVVLIFSINNYAILKQFSDYRIVSFLDNDAKGEEYNKKIHELIPTSSFVDWDSITEKDVNELLVVGKDEEVLKLIENPGEYDGLSPNLDILGVYDFMNKQRPPRGVMLEPWLLENQYVVISGERGVGKSLLSMALCLHLSMGTSFCNWKPTKRYKTLYIDGEMTCHDLLERLKTFNLKEFKDLNEYFYIYSVLEQDNTIQAHLTNPKFREQVEDFLVKNGIDLVVFDNKSSLTPGIDENNKKDYDEINQFFVSLRSKGINPIVIAHKGKNTKGPRGTSGIEDHNDISIELSLPGNYDRSKGCDTNMRITKMRSRINNLLMFYRLAYVKNTDDSHYQWKLRDTTQDNQDMFICLALNDGIPQKRIAKKYSISEPSLSKKKTIYRTRGYIDNQGKLTDEGIQWVMDVIDIYNVSEKEYLTGFQETEMETCITN